MARLMMLLCVMFPFFPGGITWCLLYGLLQARSYFRFRLIRGLPGDEWPAEAINQSGHEGRRREGVGFWSHVLAGCSTGYTRVQEWRSNGQNEKDPCALFVVRGQFFGRRD